MKNSFLFILLALAILSGSYFIYNNMNSNKVQNSEINKIIPMAKKEVPKTSSNSEAITDYSLEKHWLKIPTKTDKEVDIFYLYPTAWQKTKDDDIISKIDNPSMLKWAKLAFDRQATAFETVWNIYAPYYRQVDAKSTLPMPLDEQQKILTGIPTKDVIAAFDYYIKNYNNGRPFILASHSQWSNIMIYLLGEYMKENPEVYKKMIAAYVIWYSVTPQYLESNPHLKFAEGPDDTGVIISYNTEAPTIPWKNPVVLSWALVINPISWTREEILAPASQNLWSVALNKDWTALRDASWQIIAVKNYADAKVDKTKGVLITSTLDQSKLVLWFWPWVFHSYDYPLYFFNIRENAQNRVNKFLWKK